jgi:outer membrane protein OmpA-like peptidoglycan-associated protein
MPMPTPCAPAWWAAQLTATTAASRAASPHTARRSAWRRCRRQASSPVRPLAQPLHVIGQALRDQPAVVRVEVHTDASGSRQANLALSQRRADTIRLYLIERGVDPHRVLAVGMGSSRPVIASDPLAPGNRRIEIVRL